MNKWSRTSDQFIWLVSEREREKERERESVCVCERERVCVCVYICPYTSGLALVWLLNILVLSGDTLYCKLEKKKKHPEESPYTALGAPCKQAVFTNQAFNENADPDHVYSNTADENGGHDNAFDENVDPGHIYSNAADENGGHDNNGNSSVYANLESGLSSVSVVSVWFSEQ